MTVKLNRPWLEFSTAALQAGGVDLAHNLDVRFEAGKLHLLQGANGVGKSTLLRRLAYSIDKQSFFLAPPFGLRDELTVQDQLNVYLSHLPVLVNEKTVDDLLAQVNLLDWALERVSSLSSGQRARLGLCPLMLNVFPVWLLDEPQNALDVEGIALLARLVQSHLDLGGWVVMASHQDASSLLACSPSLQVQYWELFQGQLTSKPNALEQTHSIDLSTTIPQVSSFQTKVVGSILEREIKLLKASPQSVLWGALFHWMVLGFFGLSVLRSDAEFAQAAVWVSTVLAVLLAGKDWFSEDQRTGWFTFLHVSSTQSLPAYWFGRCGVSAIAQIVAVVPVAGLAALQFGLSSVQAIWLACALVFGILAATPILGLISLMVMLTRGGAVLVYVLALPLMVPILIFGLEASQAAQYGRSLGPPFAVLGFMAAFGFLLAPWVAKHLIKLIQE